MWGRCAVIVIRLFTVRGTNLEIYLRGPVCFKMSLEGDALHDLLRVRYTIYWRWQ